MRKIALRKFTLIVATVGVSTVMMLGIAELALRVLPIPGITYHSYYFDELTGERFYPNTTRIYRNDRNDHVRRRVNSWGYLDTEREIEKPDNVVRIGFFGDSFTEARQVELVETFHKIIETRLNSLSDSTQYECIAIAMMGFGTLQSYLECQRWMNKLDLDHVAYVFCENDPGNHIREICRIDALPYPYLRGDSLFVDSSFRERYKHKTKWPHRMWQYMKSHTLLFSTLETRLKFLRQRGIKMGVDEAERLMAAEPKKGELPDVISPPSTWPDSFVTRAEEVTERVILDWAQYVQSSGRRFNIIYIPRPLEMHKPPEEQDTWSNWLFGLCAENQIELVDPSARFVEGRANGQEIFYDHLSQDGHARLADEFIDTFFDSTD